MPKSAILCDCAAANVPTVVLPVLDMFAQSQRYVGMQFGDSANVAYFLHCRRCGGIFYENGGDEPLEPAEIHRYTGALTKEQLLKAVPAISGHWYGSTEKQFLAPPPKVSVDVPASGQIGVLPLHLRGKKVVISLEGEE